MWNTGFLPSPAWCAISCRLTWPWNARRLNMGNHKTSDQFLPSPVQHVVLSRLNWRWLHQRVKHRKTQTMIKWTLDWNPKVSNTGNHKTHDWFLPSPVQHAVLLFETKWQWNTKESNTADSSPPLSNVQFFLGTKWQWITKEPNTADSYPFLSSVRFFQDKMTEKHQRAKHSRFLPFPVQCPLFSGQNDRETPKSQTQPIPTLSCPVSTFFRTEWQRNTKESNMADSYPPLSNVHWVKHRKPQNTWFVPSPAGCPVPSPLWVEDVRDLCTPGRTTWLGSRTWSAPLQRLAAQSR